MQLHSFSLLLLLLLFLLTAIGLIGVQSALANSQSMEKCINRMHVQHSNLKKIVECLARSANLTAFMEDTLWKLDLLDHRLDRLETMQSPEVYVRSPYVHIDDVLKINASVAAFSCQSKQHVIQAIRRKLEHSHLMNARESTLFDWPPTRPRMRTKVPPKFDGYSLSGVTTELREAKELSCLIAKAIERHAKPLVSGTIGN